MKHTELSNQDFDLTAYLLEVTYGMMGEEDIAAWDRSEAANVSRDLRRFGIVSDPEEIYATVAEFIAQDAAEAE